MIKKQAPESKDDGLIRTVREISIHDEIISIEETALSCGTLIARKVLGFNDKKQTRAKKAQKKFEVNRKIDLKAPSRPAIKFNPTGPDSDRDLHPFELVRAGGVYLFRVVCPGCSEVCAIGFPDLGCCKCGHIFAGSVIDVSKIKAKRNLVALVYKKERQRRISKAVVRSLLSLQEGLCAYCDCHLTTYHVDHIVPVIVGGSSHITNLAIACPRCNLTAGSKCFDSFLEKKYYILDQIKRKTS